MAGVKTSNNVMDKNKLILLGVLILIIIILVYLFSIDFGIFSSVPPGGLNLPCISPYNYTCVSATLSSDTGNLTVTLRQGTGANWKNVYFVFVTQGAQVNSSGVPQVSFSQPTVAFLPYLHTGATVTINLTIAEPDSLSRGQKFTGTIWAKYMINGTNQTSYAQIASINIKAS